MRFPIIYADPAWTYDDKALAGNRGAGCKYSLMTERDIYALPVGDIAAKDALLFLWVTMPKLREGLECIAAWGFTYKTCAFTWVKNTGTGSWFIGMGRWTRSNAELCLLGVKGKPQRQDAGVNQIICAPRMKHSAKPPETRDRIVRLAGDLPRVELFARDECDGWCSLGNEIDGQDLRDSIPALARVPF
jgi:site-specific DNA-methyltransferase (adenine-specific)